MKETRIYVISFEDWDKYREEYNSTEDLYSISNELFMTVAENLGGVYSLKGFQQEWNCGYAPNPDLSHMRILEVEIP